LGKAAAKAATFFAVSALATTLVATPAAAQTGPVFVDSIAVEGNERLADAVILGVMNLQPGTNMTYRDIQRAIKELWATGQFTDVNVRATGGEADPVVQVAFAKEFIRAELADEGIPFANIEERIEELEGRTGEIALFLDVTEGNRVTLANVVFTGNEALSDDDIAGAMGTKEEGFWWFRPGSFEQAQLEEDLNARLPAAYAERGYLDFRIAGDSLIIDPTTGKAILEIQLDEGRQYRLSDFSVEGNSVFPTDVLEAYFRVEDRGLLGGLGFGGDGGSDDPVFNRAEFEAATARIQELYSDNGYLYAQVEPWLERMEAEEPDGSPMVEVGWRIVEGNPAYVRRVAVQGNDYTYEWVVRDKIFLLPGDVFSRALLIQSYQSISSLGFFEAPMDPPDVLPDPETGDVDIVFHVAERQTGSVNFGTAVGGGTGLSGFLGYDQPNLFGQAKEGHIRWDFGRYQNNLSLSFSDPALFQSRVSGSVSVFAGRDRFFSFQTGERNRIGTNFRFGFPVPGSLRSRFFLGYGLSRTSYKTRAGSTDQSLFGLPPGTQSTVSLSIVRATLNHPLFPTSGSRTTLGVEKTGGILGGDGDFSKWTAEGTWWVPVGGVGDGLGGPSLRFALGLSLRGGMLFGDASIFPFDRFWMGGVQFGEMLRGYDETTITPFGYFPENSGAIADINRLGNAFLSLTAEYAARFGDNLSLSLFYDAGNTWRSPWEIDPGFMYRGAGVGVQIVTPFGPLGLDYAYGFDKPVPGWQLHFRLGPGF
jgi:outer membrane protein insertion porin family